MTVFLFYGFLPPAEALNLGKGGKFSVRQQSARVS
jgi:hypothetical protein